MPFNQDKRVKLPELLAQVRRQLEAKGSQQVLTFFEVFLEREFVRTLIQQGWQADVGEIDLAPGDFDVFYPVAVVMLRDAAGRNFSDIHRDTYQDAHSVSDAICAVLNEHFECSGEDGLFDLIPVRSYVELAIGVDPAKTWS